MDKNIVEDSKYDGFTGKSLQSSINEHLFKICCDAIKIDNSLAIDYDTETGEPFLVTKEQMDIKNKFINESFNSKNKGRIIVAGISDNDVKRFKDLWTDGR